MEMDGNMGIRDQVILLRAVIGRKIMEIDDFENKLTDIKGDEAEQYLDMIDFLKKDIIGYKSIVDDLRDGSNDLTGDLWDIASLPEKSLSLYTEFYLPALSDEDREEDTKAMEIKAKYAQDLARAYVIHIGRMALMDPNVVEKILANEDLVTLIGTVVLDTPELLEEIEKQ
ncbi:MAG: hypothetical protein FWC44_03210 [Methanomassiliicoccaceae archaeon]|nr:hypothetical protein [Methanomassiliicoccaceae archaeon]